MMKFTVIDKQTGKYPNLQAIVRKEDWAKNLIYCDVDGFLVNEDGYLFLYDDYGNIAYCPQDRFKVIYQDGFGTPESEDDADG